MRSELDAGKARRLLRELGNAARGPGRIYLTGGTSAVLEGWRRSTVDADLKLDPEDVAAGMESPEALLVSIAAKRLRRQGLPVPETVFADAELRLYRALCREDPQGAYGRYNALIRRLVSFAHALELAEGKAIRARRA